jgi:hypothetical protein
LELTLPSGGILLHPFGVGVALTIAFLYSAYFGSFKPFWQHLAAQAVH